MADTKISDLPEATTLSGLETILLSQGASDAKASLIRVRNELDWARPDDWPAMPATAANTIRLLAAVHDHQSNFAVLKVTVSGGGTYSVDWGDGTSDTGITSATNIEHVYDYADGDLPSETSRGYKVAVVTITASGGNITALDTAQIYTGTTGHTAPWLEMQINASSCTSFILSSASTLNRAPRCEYVNFVTVGTITTHANMFFGWSRLEKVTLPSNFFTSTTSLSQTFRECRSLRRVDLSSLGTALVSAQAAFFGCVRIRSVDFPSGTLGSTLTNFVGVFEQCFNLEEVSFPSGSLTHVTSLATTFNFCYSLRNVTFPSGALAAVTSLSFAFGSCTSLASIAFPASSLASVTTIANAFNGCASLTEITFPTGSFGSLTTTTNAFLNCASLSRIQNCLIRVSFSLLNCRLGAPALDEIYTALPTISSQTITVTGNYGTSADTPSIATGKGWTVTGS
jgi:hypothetical protein